MTLDGIVDASGGTSIVSGGGGAGGSVLLIVRNLLNGFGKITASGGKAVGIDSGGGSGGRIAVYAGKQLQLGKYEEISYKFKITII